MAKEGDGAINNISTDALSWIVPDVSSSPTKIDGTVSVMNLFGTPAVGTTVKGSLQLKPVGPTVKDFPGFSFINPYSETKSFSEDLGEVSTDAQGNAVFDLKLHRFQNAIYRLVFLAEAKELGSGRTVYSQVRTTINPLPYLVGFSANSNLNFVRRGSQAAVQVIAIDNQNKKVATPALTEKVSRIDSVSTLMKNPAGTYVYGVQEKKIPIREVQTTISEAGNTIDVANSFDPGTYSYELYSSVNVDDATRVLEFRFSVVGDSGLHSRNPKVSEVKVRLNKRDFQAHDPIDIALEAPYPGSGFITIAKDKVYAHQFFHCETTECTQSIAMPEDLEGNGYVQVDYVRAVDSDDIYTNPFSSAVEPILVNAARRTVPITITSPNKVKPGTEIALSVSAIRPTKAVVSGVDEGILQVARYKRPDPMSVFYAKKSLEVSTTQILDLLLPEYEVERRLAAIGGDDDAILGKVKNPFKRKNQKPVVYFSDIIDLDAAPKILHVPVPDYFNGTVHFFAVGADLQSVGVTESTTTVQGDLIVQPTVPLAVAPGDVFTASALVTNIAADQKVVLSVQPEVNGIELVDTTGGKTPNPLFEKSISVGSEGVFEIPMRASDHLGDKSLTFTAKAGNKTASYTLSLSVRPPTIKRTQIVQTALTVGDNTVKNLPKLYADFGTKTARISNSPSVFLAGLSEYVGSYPYGCSEQLLSQIAFKVAYDLEPDAAFIRRALQLLAGRVVTDSGVALWDGESISNPDASMHAALVFLKLSERNIAIPDTQKSFLLQYLRDRVTLNPSTNAAALQSAKSLYYLTAFEEMVGDQVVALRTNLDSDPRFKGWNSGRIGLFLAGAYRGAQFTDEGNELIKKVVLPNKKAFLESGTNGAVHTFEDYLAVLAEYQEVLRKYFVSQYATSWAASLQSQINDELYAGHFSTYSAAKLALASSDAGTPIEIKAFSVGDESVTVNAKIPSFIQVISDGYAVTPPADSEHGIDIHREYVGKDGAVLSDLAHGVIKVGDEVTVRIRVRSNTTDVYNAVISDVLPAGFEIIKDSPHVECPDCFSPLFKQLLDDRALFFGDITTKPQLFEYRLRAVTKGEFVLPAITAESMYAPDVYGVFGSGRIRID